MGEILSVGRSQIVAYNGRLARAKFLELFPEMKVTGEMYERFRHPIILYSVLGQLIGSGRVSPDDSRLVVFEDFIKEMIEKHPEIYGND